MEKFKEYLKEVKGIPSKVIYLEDVGTFAVCVLPPDYVVATSCICGTAGEVQINSYGQKWQVTKTCYDYCVATTVR